MDDVVIFGAGQIAEVAKAYLDRSSTYRVVGFTVDESYLSQSTFCGLPVVAWEKLEARFPPGVVRLLGPLSYQRLNEFRRDRFREGKTRGYDFATFIHPSTHNLAEVVGENCFILENCILQPFSRIGDGAMIWSGVIIGHHCVVEDFCFLSSQVAAAGNSRIGTMTFIGGQAGVDGGVIIGAESFIESRVVIRRSVPANSVVRHEGDVPRPYSSQRLKKMKFR